MDTLRNLECIFSIKSVLNTKFKYNNCYTLTIEVLLIQYIFYLYDM